MNISEALKEKGLKLVAGERRLKSELSANGRAIIFVADKGQHWEVVVEDGLVRIAETDKIEGAHPAKQVSSSQMFGLNPRNLLRNPINVRATADDSPSL
ncbi:hypothetical protein [Pseudomonas amygdali]|uniref:Uncharacterized protein n=2 Tax=Pseudomonas amygdali pv. lachrymans TaxID=53707 RepID=A0ABR5KRE7_PSEAV|nr:hypothetical protein [Pseudomonas amygdali]AXH59735.1 hypothetical protein PLA107_031425 [Pseudomonas amygdali pv. lachrymans str. M301315]KPC17157.1 Uncharacterized protein AC499_0359 [Pseudomonas amygdali pv. lachrymans]KPC18116.1 Uncharacterized protein AC499_1318 [Pseudomonas amygdali pv. lachrymans]